MTGERSQQINRTGRLTHRGK